VAVVNSCTVDLDDGAPSLGNDVNIAHAGLLAAGGAIGAGAGGFVGGLTRAPRTNIGFDFMTSENAPPWVADSTRKELPPFSQAARGSRSPHAQEVCSRRRVSA
jgi:hypothetical protein